MDFRKFDRSPHGRAARLSPRRRSGAWILALLVALTTATLATSARADVIAPTTYSDGVALQDCALVSGYHGSFGCQITASPSQPGAGSLYISAYYSWDGATPNGYTSTGHSDYIYAGQSFRETRTYCVSYCGYGETQYIVGGCVSAYYNGKYYFRKPFGSVTAGSCPETYNNFDGSSSAPTVTIDAAPATVTADSPSSTVTATLSKSLKPPYSLSIYNMDTNTLLGCTQGSVTTYSVSVSPAANHGTTVGAFVAQDCPSTQLPQVDSHPSDTVTVTNVGWDGSVALDAQVNTSAGTALLDAEASKSLPVSATLQISADGTLVATCSAVAACSVTQGLTAPGTQVTYTADVIVDSVSEADASLLLDGPTIVEQLVDGISVADAAATIDRQIAEGAVDDPCNALLFVPGPHSEGTSTPDTYNECEKDTQLPWRSRLIALAKKYGPGIIGILTASYVLKSDGGPAAPPTITPGGPLPTDVEPSVTASQGDVDRVAQRIQQQSTNLKATSLKIQTLTDAQTLARTCLEYVAKYLDPTGGNRCANEMIFAPGHNVQDAAQHDLEAIESYPLWLQLNYTRGATKDSQGNSRKWYQGQCGTYDTTVQQCDEYPYYASRQGGNLASPLPSLKPVLAAHNQDEGNFAGYGGFISWCRPNSDAVDGLGGTPFLVVPMAGDVAPDTLWSCGRDRTP